MVSYLVLQTCLLGSVLPLAAAQQGTLRSSKVAPHSSFLSVTSDSAYASQKKKDAARRIENLVTYVDHSKAVGKLNSAELNMMTAGITTDSYKDTLSSFIAGTGKSRHINDPGNQRAIDYITEKFKAAGFTVQIVPEGETSTRNVVAFKKGTDLGHETALFGAHFDSVNHRVPGGDAPGVNDNGSGVASLLSVAEALKGHTSRRSIAVVALNSEEQGLLGSAAFVHSVVTKKEHPELGDIKAAIIADEVSFPGRKEYTNQAIFETDGKVEGSEALVDTLAHNVDDPSGSVSGFKVNYNGFGSDHMSFLNANVPALLLIERDDEWHAEKYGHSSLDTFDADLSMEYGAKMTRLGLRSFAQILNPA